MWIVFKTSPESPLYAEFFPSGSTSQQISHALGYVNWYGSAKGTEQEAILDAEEAGFEFGYSAARLTVLQGCSVPSPAFEDLDWG